MCLSQSAGIQAVTTRLLFSTRYLRLSVMTFAEDDHQDGLCHKQPPEFRAKTLSAFIEVQ